MQSARVALFGVLAVLVTDSVSTWDSSSSDLTATARGSCKVSLEDAEGESLMLRCFSLPRRSAFGPRTSNEASGNQTCAQRRSGSLCRAGRTCACDWRREGEEGLEDRAGSRGEG
eukprot:755938-Hanusia_phi.AAC.1